MSELQQIWLILAAVCWAESFCWVPAGCLLLRSTWGRRAKVGDPATGSWLLNHAGAILPGHVPPFGWSTLCPSWPVSISAEGLCNLVDFSAGAGAESAADEGIPVRSLRWTDATRILAEGRTIRINDVPFRRVASAGYADVVARFLRKVRDAAPDARAGLIDRALEKSLDAVAVRDRLETAKAATGMLRVLVLLQGAWLFGTLGAAAFLDVEVPLLQGAYVYLVLALMIAWHWWSAHAELHPHEGPTRGQELVMMLLLPAHLLHARDSVFHRLLELHHPLAVAAVAARPAEFARLAERAGRELSHPVPDGTAGTNRSEAPDAGGSVEERRLSSAVRGDFAARFRGKVADFLREWGQDPAGLGVPPRESPEAERWCPRCLRQFERAVPACDVCGVGTSDWRPAAEVVEGAPAGAVDSGSGEETGRGSRSGAPATDRPQGEPEAPAGPEAGSATARS